MEGDRERTGAQENRGRERYRRQEKKGWGMGFPSLWEQGEIEKNFITFCGIFAIETAQSGGKH